MIYSLLRPFLFLTPPEVIHDQVLHWQKVMPLGFFKRQNQVSSPKLHFKHPSFKFKNPIGLAAGFDKNAKAIHLVKSMGFGFLEVGSITQNPSKGNPKPRIFRAPAKRSMLNFMGLPNEGIKKILPRLQNQNFPLGLNIAKTPKAKSGASLESAIEEYFTVLNQLKDLGTYHVFNLSCPNTSSGKTFEEIEAFDQLASYYESWCRENQKSRPLLIKLAPSDSLKKLRAIIERAEKAGFDGYVLTNTLPHSPANSPFNKEKYQKLKGGLSGALLKTKANETLNEVVKIAGNQKLIMGVGGVLNFNDLMEKFFCGAQLVQVYTGLIYQGPLFIGQLKRQLLKFLDQHKLSHYQELIGNQKLHQIFKKENSSF